MSLSSKFKQHWLKSSAAIAGNAAVLATGAWLYVTQEDPAETPAPDIDITTQETSAPLSRPALSFPDIFEKTSLFGLPPAPPQNVMNDFGYKNGDILLNPFLVKALEEDPQARSYLRMIKEAADAHGLDWRLCANQIFRESLHFSDAVIRGAENSSRGAVGIAQFMPATAAEYGFTIEDIQNPATAITLYAQHMSNLKDANNGDMALALISYNAGDGAIDWAREEMKKPDAGGQDIMAFLQDRYNTLGNTDPHAYHVETRGYVEEITRTEPGNETPEWILSQNNQFNDPYFVGGILNEAHNLNTMYPVYEAPVETETASPLAPETSPRPKPRPFPIQLAQN